MKLEDFDNTIATAEGWDIFESSGSTDGAFTVQRCDEADILEDDSAAWKLLWDKASEGSQYHQDALALIKDLNSEEFDRIAYWATTGNEIPRDPVTQKSIVPVYEGAPARRM